jgi:hypothetical protein
MLNFGRGRSVADACKGARISRLMEEDAAADRSFIAALAISKARGGLAAPLPPLYSCFSRPSRLLAENHEGLVVFDHL